MRERRELILERWRRGEEDRPGKERLALPALLDHVPALLERIARAVAIEEPSAALADEPTVHLHALQRLEVGMGLAEVMDEYARLRDAVFEVWHDAGGPRVLHEVQRLQALFDAICKAAVRDYTAARERTLRALDEVSRASLEARDEGDLLHRLLLALVETSEVVDAALILLADDGELRPGGDLGFGAALSGFLEERLAALVEEGGVRRAQGEGLMERLGRDVLEQSGFRAVHAGALVEDDQVLGLALAASRSAESFSPADRLVFDAMTARAVTGLTKLRLSAMVERSAREQAAVAELGMKALGVPPPEAVMRDALDVATRELGCPVGWVLELREDGEALSCRVAVGLDEDRLAEACQQLEPAHVRELARSTERVRVEDAQAAVPSMTAKLLEGLSLKSGMVASLGAPALGGGVCGLIGVYARERRCFQPEDAAFLRAVANVVATSLTRSRAEAERRRLTEALEEERARLHAVVEQTPLGVWLAEAPSGRIVLDNRVGREMTSRAAGEPGALQHYAQIPARNLATGEPYRPETWPLSRSLQRGEVVVDEEMEYDTADGARLVSLARSAPLYSRTGEIVGAIATGYDITARKREEERARLLDKASRELSSSLDYERTLGTVVDLAVPGVADGCGVHLLDDGALRVVAAKHADPTQVDRVRELFARYPSRPEDVAGPRAVLARGGSILRAEISDEELRASARDARHLELLEQIIPRSYLGVPLVVRGQAIGVLELVTEGERRLGEEDVPFAEELGRRFALALDNARLYREREIAEEEARFLADASRGLVESLDIDTTLRAAARLAIPRLADLSVAVLLDEQGQPARFVVESTAPERAAVLEQVLQRHGLVLERDSAIAQVLRGGRPELVRTIVPGEIRRVVPDPEGARLVEGLGFTAFAGFPLLARGRIIGGVGFFLLDPSRRYSERDRRLGTELSHRCALALDNARLYQEAQESARMREHVLAVVSHDLKNPLAAIQMNAQLLKRTAEAAGGRVTRTADTIMRASDRMTRMINDLVDIRSIQRGRLAIEKQPSDLREILHEARDEARSLTSERGIRVQVSAQGPILVECDRQRILQVLSNLVGNAVKASAEGSEIKLGVDARNGDVLVWVRDQGKGISADDMRHLFQPYWRGHDVSYAGAGLGLAISKGIVGVHGGRIWAESAPGRGSTFFFTLPRQGARTRGEAER